LAAEKPVVFPPYRLDPANECVWLGPDSLVLTRKAYGVLRYLLQHPSRLVTKNELLDAVWPETHVGEAVLKVAVAELRKALNDSSQDPLYIETVHRRGYRFIGEIVEPASGITPRSGRAVEREPDLARLEGWLARALEGERHMVFITGEAGIGKTTLVEAFTERAAGQAGLWAAHGQCLEHFGEGEPYLPLLEAFTRLCRQPGKERLVDLMRQHAPTWLAQMPSIVSEADRDLLRREVLGSARERMLREITEAVEALTAETPLLLVLEDLHWCDNATVDVISYLARRRGRARLMLLGTYRPAEVIVKQHPLASLKRELQVRGHCFEAAIGFLSERAVDEYLALRFPGGQFPPELARLIHQRTEGNPLFMVSVVDYLLAQQQIVRRKPPGTATERWTLDVPIAEIEIGIPDSLLQMIERQLELLRESEQEMLLVASVAGLEFSTRTLAGAGGGSAPELGVLCHALVRRRQFLRPAATIQLHDGSLLERYGFIHSLYQHALYRGVPEARRVLLHRALGEFQESAYSRHLDEIAAELAMHFEEGRDYAKAIQYRRMSAANASRRYANREAIEHLDRALRLVERFAGRQRAELEGAIREERAAAHRAMDDNSAAALDLERVVACAAEAGQLDWEVKALLKLGSVLFWTDHQRSLEVAEAAVQLSSVLPEEWLYLQARGHRASRRIRLRGWSEEDFADCVTARAAAKQAGDSGFYGWHAMSCAFFYSYRSEGREACRAADEGMQIGIETGDAFLYMSCQYFKAWALLHLGEWGETLRLTRQGLRLSQANGHTTGEAVLRLIEARLHLEAQDFARARELALETLPMVRPGFPEFVASIALAEGQAGLGESETAWSVLQGVLQRSREGPFRLDWIFHLPLYRSLAELALARGDYEGARVEANRLCELAALPGERTYLAIGRSLLAHLALAQDNGGEAAAQVAQAVAELKDLEAPLAEWRVFATAAEVARQRGDTSEAASWRVHALFTLERIARSLDAAEPLHQALLRVKDQHPQLRQAMAERT
jgi:DNA-binding winged helix-turn-helix (wHTH) protein